MPIQYPDMPQFQAPNLNLMGAYAQGAALQQQQLQEERLRQQMDLAERSAAYTANKDVRETELAQSRLYGQQFENLAKLRNQLREDLASVNSQEETDRIFAKYVPIAGDILPQDRTYSEANKKKWLMGADKYLEATKPIEREEQAPDGSIVKVTGFINPYTNAFVKTEERAVPEKWTPVRGEKQEIIYYTNPSGTQMLSPEEYKTKMMRKEQPAEAPATRGQAGNFAAPMAAPAAPMDVYNNVPMAQIKQGFSKIESGSPEGNYAALGPVLKSGDRAYGKYQVMGANIPSWTKQALGRSMTPEEFLASPEAQEKVFESQFQRNFKKYGTVEDAASVWFSGRPLAQATRAGARDVNMGVPEYVQKVVGGMGPYGVPPTVPLTGINPSLRALTERPVNAMAEPFPPVNALAAPAQMPQAVTAPAPTPMAQAPRAPIAAPPTMQTPEERQARQLQFVKSAPIGKESQYQGKVSLENTLTDFANELAYLDSQGKAPSVRHNPLKNAELSAEGSWLGQTWGRFTGTPAQSTRDAIESIRQNLVSIVAKAAGKTGQQMNSNFDVKNALKAIGDPKATVESLMATLNNLNKTFGTNAPIQGSPEFSESRRQIEAAKAMQNMPEAAGIDPAAIKMLMAQPETAAAFDAHFGVPGLAAKILGR